jgi:mitochondrial fission protein ELM1
MTGVRAGDNDQVIALAEALGLPFEIRRLEYNALCHLGPRLLGSSMASLTPASRAELLRDEPPDLTISAGHRSVPVVQALRARSGGRLRSIHVGFPRISPDNFDLVVTTPQYPIADEPNLLRLPFALTRAATAAPDRADEKLLEDLPHRRALVIVGGPTLFWRIDEARLLDRLKNLLGEAARDGGSVMVTTSPRTRAKLQNAIAKILATAHVPTLVGAPGRRPSYASLLAAADSIHVTADSVSMASDAIWTGKPTALVPIRKSIAGRIYFAVMDVLRPGRPVYPQDLRFFWRALGDIGLTERLGTPNASAAEELRKVRDAIGPLLSRT